MKTLLTAAAVALIAGAAAAQYKTPPPSTVNRGSVQLTPNPNVVITPTQPQADDDLAKARRISREDAMNMITHKKAVYVDVRSKQSYDEAHIPGAISIPLSELIMRLKDLPPRKFIITYCA